MENNESFKVRGDVELTLTGSDGQVKQHIEIKNLVVATGKAFIASRMMDASQGIISHIGIGTNATAPNISNTSLGTQVARVTLTGAVRTDNQIAYSAFFAAGVGTGTIVEAGLFNAPVAGTMLCRTVFSPVSKDALDTLTINWTVTIL